MKTTNKRGLITAVVCFLVFFIGNYAQYQISPIAGTVMAELGINVPQFSLLFTACMYPALALSLVSGLLCDKFGAKRCVALALTLSAAGMIGRIMFTANYTMTLACMALTGLGCMFLTATSAKILAPHFGERLGQVMGPVSAGNTLGMFIAMATTAYFPSTKSAYTVSAVLAVFVLTAWLIFAKDPVSDGAQAPQGASVGESLKICLKNKYVWLCGVTMMLLMVGQIMIASSLPIALQTEKGMDASTTGTISSVYMVGAILGTTFGPQLFFGLKKGKRLFVTCAAVITGVGVAFAWHIPNVVLLCATLVLCGACLSSFIPMIMSLPVTLPGVGPAYAGTAGGLVATIQIIGCTIIPTNILTPMFTSSANVTDFGTLFIVSGVIAACAAVTVNMLPIYNEKKIKGEFVMAREKYNREKEHTVIGTYPPIMGMELGGAADSTGVCIVPESPRFYRPIETRRNMKMLFEGKKPYWMPNNGWFGCDINEFRPRQNPDNFANHQCIDGGPYIDYKQVDRKQVSWFKYVMVWEPLSMGATTYPGNPTLDDINDWEEKVVFPNLDDIDWEEMREMNKKYLDHDKVNQLGIQMGMWERLMCLMDVSNAAMALVDEDQEDAMHAFLDKLSDFYVEYIRRVHEVCPLDSVMFHDDWGTQNGPFFSLETARQFFVKPMKKITDFCHANDIIFEHHSCGCAQDLVPAMIEEGDDFWFPQAAINDLDMLVEKYKDEKRFCIALSSPVLPKGSTPEQVYEIAKNFVEKYKDRRVLFCQDVSITDPNHDPSLYPIFADAVYECSRIAFQDVEGQD